MDKRPCQATASHGAACGAWAPADSTYCRVHDPSKADEVQAARIRGARKAGQLRLLRGKRVRLDSAGRLIAFASDVVQDVRSGVVEPDIARVALYGCAIPRQLVETSDLEKRIAELESQAAIDATGRSTRWA